jgi:hypothetical protein
MGCLSREYCLSHAATRSGQSGPRQAGAGPILECDVPAGADFGSSTTRGSEEGQTYDGLGEDQTAATRSHCLNAERCG